jgi:hypothetical protein
MAFLPPLICVVQTVSKRRQTNRLTDLKGFPIQQTVSYRTALATISAIEDSSIGSAYTLPMLVYFLTVAFGGVGFLIGYNELAYFAKPNLLLIGLYSGADAISYQRETFVVIGIAFFASYSYSLGMLLNRINTYDLQPILLYYNAVRLVVATISAAVLRHVFGAFQDTATDAMLIVASFAVGVAPDLFVLTIIRKGFQALKTWASRDDPADALRPTAMPLLMIDDLTREKIDHLNEIGIDSIQVLARQNPLLLLTRLPYELALIVDWIAQAQLYVLVREKGMQAMRNIYVRDIFDLRLNLIGQALTSRITAALGLADDTAVVLAAQIDAEPTYLRLLQVREAMAANTEPAAP